MLNLRFPRVNKWKYDCLTLINLEILTMRNTGNHLLLRHAIIFNKFLYFFIIIFCGFNFLRQSKKLIFKIRILQNKKWFHFLLHKITGLYKHLPQLPVVDLIRSVETDLYSFTSLSRFIKCLIQSLLFL